MRKLNAKDLFKGLRLFKKLDVKKDLEQITTIVNSQNEKDAEKIGLQVIMTVLEKAANEGVDELVYDLLSGPLELTPDAVSELELHELINKILEIASVEEWKAFFSHAVDIKTKMT